MSQCPTAGPGSRAGAPGDLAPGGPHYFPGEIFQAPRSWAEQLYPNLSFLDEVDRCGHFAVWKNRNCSVGNPRSIQVPAPAQV